MSSNKLPVSNSPGISAREMPGRAYEENMGKSTHLFPVLMKRPGVIAAVIASVCLVFTALLLDGWAMAPPKGEINLQPSQTNFEEKWGIKIEGLRLSAAGYMLDFRYKIVDPDKAIPVVDHKQKPYIIDQESGAAFVVPNSGKVGQLRNTDRRGKPLAGRTYFILFANPGKFVKLGNRVSVVIGDFRAENLIVQ